MLCRLCVIASFDGSPWVLPHAHAWVLLPPYTVCCALYFILNMPCTADTTTWLGTAIALYYMLCTTDTATCMGIAIALYYICYAPRIPPHAWVLPLLYYTIYAMHCGYHHILGHLPSLYTRCYALLILPHAWVLPSLCITCYDTLTCVGTTIVLYCMLYAMHALSTCVCTATALYIYAPIVYNCMLCTQRC